MAMKIWIGQEKIWNMKMKFMITQLFLMMSIERLNGFATLSIEKDMLANIDVEEIINDFASQNARRNCFL
jgi:hypothetical protein